MNPGRITDWAMPEPMSGCYLWLRAIDSGGYGSLRRNGQATRTHRIAWEEAHGQIRNGFHVLHHCDVRSCVNVHHLFLGKDLENQRDCSKKNRKNPALGERASKAKLTESQVRAIRHSTETHRILADRYGISPHAVWIIRARRAWKHLTETPP